MGHARGVLHSETDEPVLLGILGALFGISRIGRGYFWEYWERFLAFRELGVATSGNIGSPSVSRCRTPLPRPSFPAIATA